MRALICFLALLSASVAHAQWNAWGHAQAGYQRLQDGSAYYPYAYAPVYVAPVYVRPYRYRAAYSPAYVSPYYDDYETARELRLLRWSVEDAEFNRRWNR